MPVDTTSSTAQGVDSIPAEASNAKLFGKRCTARINAGEYNEALQDAKTLVRLLPDAPIGYLKAARCYRLLKKLKAAQKMLDMAIERADDGDEGTIRAACTEQRKITEDARALADERSRPFADQLPEEIFLHVASHLSQRDLVRAAQVNQTWRKVLHARPDLWTTMYLNITPKDFKKRSSTSTRPTDNQIRYYEDRLPEDGSKNLLHLSVHVGLNLTEEAVREDTPLHDILVGRHRFARNKNLQSLALSGQWDNLSAFFLRLMGASGHGLRCLRLAGPTSLGCAEIDQYPHLKAFDIVIDDRSAEYDEGWPYVPRYLAISSSSRRVSPTSTSTSREEPPEPRATPERFVVQGSVRLGSPVFLLQADRPRKTDFTACQHLEIGGTPFSYLFEPSPMIHLRTLILHNTLFNPSYQLTRHISPELATTGHTAIDEFLQPPLDFPVLETFQVYYMDVTGPGQAVANARQKLRPTPYLCRLNAPKLRHLTISNFGPITPTSPALHAREQAAWSTFCKNHPQLEELVLFKTTVTDLSETLPLLTNLSKLFLSHADLSSNFLKAATSPNALPGLKQLQLSHCSNITSGDLVRLVKSKNGALDYLDIEACTELQKEAVDWLKGNVKQVKWTGWRDKNDNRKGFTFRA